MWTRLPALRAGLPGLRPALVAAALALVTTGLAACGSASPELGDPLPEPTQALRPAEIRGEIPEDARIADYEIDAHLDAETHVISGRVRVTWRNRTGRTVRKMPFHLYMNAFRASDTAWMREARGEFRGDKLDPESLGYIELGRVVGRAAAGPAALESAAPVVDLVWRELDDPSVMVVELADEVPPGGVAELELDFETHLPRVFARTGYADDFHMAGQWFPKLGVLEEAAGWKAHTFTTWSEFYADFGNYEVSLDLPANMVVGATGIRTEHREEGDRQHLRYRAEMVHDFAWTADPEFVEHWGEYEGIRIRQLMRPEELPNAEAHMEAQLWTLASMERRFGAYPWTTITVVHPPPEGSGAGGMEYPTLYTTSPRSSQVPGLFEDRVSGIFTTVHEFGHQYFQGLFASDEHSEPWMDEGLNTFSNYLAYSDELGHDPWLLRLAGHELSFHDFMRLTTAQAELDPIDQPASAFPAGGASYFVTSYNKAATVLATLRNLVGHEDFDAAMTTFAARARFGHPTGDLFERTMIEGLGETVVLLASEDGEVKLSLPDYFDQALRSTARVDFAVQSARNRRRLEPSGYYRHEHDGRSSLHRHLGVAEGLSDHTHAQDEEGEPEEGDEADEGFAFETDPRKLDDAECEGQVVIVREGEFRVPVEFLVEFQDGSSVLQLWDGQARYRAFAFDRKKIRRVVIDPADKLLLEHDRLDNARYARDADNTGNGLSPVMRRLSEGLSLAALGAFAP